MTTTGQRNNLKLNTVHRITNVEKKENNYETVHLKRVSKQKKTTSDKGDWG